LKNIFYIILFAITLQAAQFGEVLGNYYLNENHKNITLEKKLLRASTINPFVIDDDIVGIYKLKNARVVLSSGVSQNFTKTEIANSLMTLSKDGIITQTIFVNNNLASVAAGYIKNVNGNNVELYNLPSSVTNYFTYSYSNDILTTYAETLSFNETDTWEKVYSLKYPTPSFVENISSSFINTLNIGWTLVGTAKEITNLSVFDNVNIIWIYQNKQWYAYSPNATMQQSIINANIKTITKIPINSGIWVNK